MLTDRRLVYPDPSCDTEQDTVRSERLDGRVCVLSRRRQGAVRKLVGVDRVGEYEQRTLGIVDADGVVERDGRSRCRPRHCNQPEHSRHNEYDRCRGEQSSVSGARLGRADGAHLRADAIDAVVDALFGGNADGATKLCRALSFQPAAICNDLIIEVSGHQWSPPRLPSVAPFLDADVSAPWTHRFPVGRRSRRVTNRTPRPTTHRFVAIHSTRSRPEPTPARHRESIHDRPASQAGRHGAPCELRSGPLGTGSRQDCPGPQRDPSAPTRMPTHRPPRPTRPAGRRPRPAQHADEDPPHRRTIRNSQPERALPVHEP